MPSEPARARETFGSLEKQDTRAGPASEGPRAPQPPASAASRSRSPPATRKTVHSSIGRAPSER